MIPINYTIAKFLEQAEKIGFEPVEPQLAKFSEIDTFKENIQ